MTIRCFTFFVFLALSALRGITGEPDSLFGQVNPVFQAVLADDSAKLTALLKQGANPNEKTAWGWAPLHQAMFMRAEIAKILLSAGADVNVRVSDVGSMPSPRWTPLFYAASLGRADLVTELLKQKVDVNALDLAGKTPLFYAVQRQHREVAELLGKAGASPLKEIPGPAPFATPAYYPNGIFGPAITVPELYQAVMLHDKARVEALLKQGADPEAREPMGGDAALYCAMSADVDIVKLLLDYGADVNVHAGQNKKGESNNWTPLFAAVYLGRDDLVAELLRRGAKVNIKDAWGKSPLWYARDRKKAKIIELLRAAGAH